MEDRQSDEQVLSREERALSREELALAEAARLPGLRALGAHELQELIGRLRERRDRARQIAGRQRRELRGKAAPTSARPAPADDGSQAKVEALTAALRRAEAERDRRAGS